MNSKLAFEVSALCTNKFFKSCKHKNKSNFCHFSIFVGSRKVAEGSGTREEAGVQCTVVFALIVTEPASESVCAAVCRFRKYLCKDDSALFSRARICKRLKSLGIDSARLEIDSWTP